MCIQIKYSRLLMKYSVSLEFLWATHALELLSREERQTALMSLWAASASPLNSACLFSGLYTFFGLFMARWWSRHHFNSLLRTCAPHFCSDNTQDNHLTFLPDSSQLPHLDLYFWYSNTRIILSCRILCIAHYLQNIFSINGKMKFHTPSNWIENGRL